MPIYDYHCSQCDKTFELLVSQSAVPACPECGNQSMEKLPSLTAPKGKTAGLVSRARAQAARQGHFSNYAPSERPRVKP
ncbi:zinc ribbon domain-containing protein [Methylocaldum sp.]|uniref:FmdB family zinc ribbon protein n=1 Tax=Methylocaldum sp. TaxID=1969727 RepID=UPI002D744CE1|nr:zinc ribbon domain-containing protein [Methylocaldum sp.]HYE37501.1 zinc ribbon domain-containing protein [Methylocaldum sp.]